MKLLLINPNISDSVTDLIVAEAARSFGAPVELLPVTASRGVEYIETRSEALIAGAEAAYIITEHAGKFDGVILAAFGDPGLPALKEVTDKPVIGITEAAVSLASLYGSRFSVISISERIVHWYRERIDALGRLSRVASFRPLEREFKDVGSVKDDFREEFVSLCQRAVVEDGADALVLAGAPLSGLAREVRELLPVPVIDGIGAAASMCEVLVRLGHGHHREGSFAPPPGKRVKGLPDGLTSIFGEQSA